MCSVAHSPLTRRSNFHLADAFTLMNGFCGAQSLFASARYLITSDPIHAWHALWFPVAGAIFDLLDGKVARWRKSSSMLGQELDSLADSVSVPARACVHEHNVLSILTAFFPRRSRSVLHLPLPPSHLAFDFPSTRSSLRASSALALRAWHAST